MSPPPLSTYIVTAHSREIQFCSSGSSRFWGEEIGVWAWTEDLAGARGFIGCGEDDFLGGGLAGMAVEEEEVVFLF